MTLVALLASVSRIGVTLSVDGSELIARPKGLLTPELRSGLSARKVEVMEVVRRRSVAANEAHRWADPRACSGCGRNGFVVMVVTACGDHLCRACWRATGTPPDVRQPETPRLDALMREANERTEREGA